MASSAIRVEGLRELDRAFKAVSREVQKELRGELKTIAEPVRRGAKEHAVADISHLGEPRS